ncbi:MAG TPA: 5'-nucleotidase C-terminal domain-containing protein [Thermoanaerobaculia bacterium]|nr:5'-nucleotidase C-terminal domain-containing protein [Thermoanaerobaculia bacterium]
MTLRGVILLVLGLSLWSPSQAETSRVTLLHFSDYHSHAVPFYADGEHGRGGIARAIGYLRREKKQPSTFVFNGGDTMNLGSPAWSDKYRCVEWPWLNGLVDAMAFGNHDADYGPATFDRCRRSVTYPILGANVVDHAGSPLFTVEGKQYVVLRSGSVRIGVVALASDGFEKLTRPETRPAAGVRFLPRIESAQSIVRALREIEGVNAVVVIGHAHREEDFELARSVPGIDLIFGTHSHIREELTRIPGTATWFISPHQYLGFISRVELRFDEGQLAGVEGRLVRMDRNIGEDRRVRNEVRRLRKRLERDPAYRSLFEPIGNAAIELSLDGQLQGETILGNLVMDVVRSAVTAHVALSTTSSFRQPIPPGRIVLEDLRAALPYENRIVMYDLEGASVRELLELGLGRRGTDAFAQLSGVRVRKEGDELEVEILRDPADPSKGFAPLDDASTYRVATTDYMARIASGYREIFGRADAVESGREVREEVRRFIVANSPVAAELDGRLYSSLITDQ